MNPNASINCAPSIATARRAARRWAERVFLPARSGIG
jgi:hypothetical protein